MPSSKVNILILSFIIPFGLTGQNYFLIKGSDTVEISMSDSAQASKFTNQQIADLINDGHLFADLDSVFEHQGDIFFQVYKGPQHEYHVDSLIGLDHSSLKHRDGPLLDMKQILKYLSDRGYPFAQVRLDSIYQDDGVFSYTLKVNKGPLIVYDSLVLLGDHNFNPVVLARSLDLIFGQVYSEESYKLIPQRIKRFSFLQLSRPPQIGFSDGKATIYLHLVQTPSSSFDGIVGLLPNQGSTNNSLITGFIDLHLGNMFKSGKSLTINWARFNEESQKLSLNYNHPYLFLADLDVDFKFNILKQDSSFLNRNIEFGLGRSFQTLHLLFNYENEVGQSTLEESFAQYKTNWYGLNLSSGNLRLMNHRGNNWSLLLKFQAGSKEVKENNSGKNIIANVKGNFDMKIQRMLGNSNALFANLNLGLLKNDSLMLNEFFRIGGLTTLRGFNELQFFVNSYYINQFEYRFFFEAQSFLQVFFDIAYLNNDYRLSEFEYWTKSFGAGMTLATQNGIFRIIFANGFHNEQSFDPGNMKIHFGYAVEF